VRIATIVATLIATLCCGLAASPDASAAPFVSSYGAGGGRQAKPAQAKTTWGLPSVGRMFGRQPQAMSQPAMPTPFVGQQQPPSTAQRFRNAFTQNPLARAMTPGSQAAVASPGNSRTLEGPTGPPTIELFTSLAKVAEQGGDVATARGYLQKAVAQAPTDANVLRQYGRLEDRQGRLAEAEKLYQQAVTANPTSTGALNDLALCYARQKKLAESVQTLEHAIAQRPDKPLYRNNIAKVLVELDANDRAIAHLAAVYGPAVAHYNLGQLLVVGGRTSEATGYFQQALALDPSLQAAHVALAKLQPNAATTPQVASLPALPAPAAQPVAQPATPEVDDRRLPSLEAPAVPAGPSFPRLLPPVGQ